MSGDLHSHTSGVAWLSKCKGHLLAPLRFLVVAFLFKLHGLGHLPPKKEFQSKMSASAKGIIWALVTSILRSLLAAVGRTVSENKALGLETLPTTELR